MNLQQFFRILRARWLLMLATLVIVVGATLAVSLVLPSRYTATASIVIDMKGIDPMTGAILPILVPASGYIATQIDIITSPRVARGAVDLLKLTQSQSAIELFQRRAEGKGDIRNWLADLLLEELKVVPSRESSLVTINYKAGDPRFAAAVANAFVQSYVSTNLEFKVEPARQTSAFFKEQIKGIKDSVEGSQARLSEYQREEGIIATDERLDVENNRLNELSSQLIAAQAQTFDAVSRRRQLEEAISKGQVPESIPDVMANPVVQSLKANLTALEAKLNELSSRIGKNHPHIQATQAELTGVRTRLTEEMRTIAGTIANAASLAQRREEQLRAALAQQRAKVLEMKKVRDDLAVLVREAENSQRAFDAASQRLTATRIESQTNQTNVLVVSEAVEPIEPSSPRIVLNTAIATLLGAMIAVGLALLREMFDRVLRSEDDIESTLGVPVIGVLGPKARWLARKQTRSLIASAGT